MNIEQLRSALERIKDSRPASEGLSCERIASVLGVGVCKARGIIREAVASGVLVQAPYYTTAVTGVTRAFVGFKLATKTTGTKRTKRS